MSCSENTAENCSSGLSCAMAGTEAAAAMRRRRQAAVLRVSHSVMSLVLQFAYGITLLAPLVTGGLASRSVRRPPRSAGSSRLAVRSDAGEKFEGLDRLKNRHAGTGEGAAAELPGTAQQLRFRAGNRRCRRPSGAAEQGNGSNGVPGYLSMPIGVALTTPEARCTAPRGGRRRRLPCRSAA